MPAYPKPKAVRRRHVVSVRINDHEKQLLAHLTQGKAKNVSEMLRVVLEDWMQQREMRKAA